MLHLLRLLMVELDVLNFYIELDGWCLWWCQQVRQSISSVHVFASFVLDGCMCHTPGAAVAAVAVWVEQQSYYSS